jgi:hypothetical protein
LARLAEAAAKDDAAETFRRCTSMARRKVCAIVREELMRSGIDPAQVPALRLGEARQTPEAEPLREERVQPDSDGLAAMFAAKIGDMVRRCENGHQPNFAKASMAELFAWCLSRRADRARGST